MERMAPTAFLGTPTNLSGAVTDIDDDPDSPDGAWLTAPGSNSPTDVRVSFDTPSAGLDNSASAQEFRVQVRKTNHSTNPTAVVELWVNGSMNSTVVSSTSVTSTTGQILAGGWTSSGIAASDVECKVVGTVGGGSPGNRASVEVGAIEWNAATSSGVSPNAGHGAVTATANDAVNIVAAITV